MMQIQAIRRYRATLWPEHIEAEDVQSHDDKGALPNIQIKATDADHAAALARLVTGHRVLRVERLDDPLHHLPGAIK